MTIDAGTVTPKPTAIRLDDVFLAVKTTQTNHAKRLNLIAKTWFQMAREQVKVWLDFPPFFSIETLIFRFSFVDHKLNPTINDLNGPHFA